MADGTIAGAVLRAARASTGLTQEKTAETHSVSVDAWKRWEGGGRPLGNVKVSDLNRTRSRLREAGARPELLRLLKDAIEADEFITRARAGDVSRLGSVVSTRQWTSLLSWAVTGTPPGPAADLVKPRPLLAAADRSELLASIRQAADRCSAENGQLLRHQAYYLAQWDISPDGKTWLADAARVEAGRPLRGTTWQPEWAVARSFAIAKAGQGDPEPLRWFIDRNLEIPGCEDANLTYWTYWAGADPAEAGDESFMAERKISFSQAAELCSHLVRSLAPGLPYLELSVRTIRSIIRRWPWLLNADIVTAGLLAERTELLLSTGEWRTATRRELSDLHRASAQAMRGEHP